MMEKQASQPVKKHRRWLRRLLGAFGVLLVLTVLLVLMLPTLASTDTGTQWVLSYVNDGIDGAVQIDDLELTWSGGQNIRGLTVQPHEDDPFTVKAVNAPDVSLWSLLRGSRVLGNITITGARGDPDVLQRVFAGPEQQQPTRPTTAARGLTDLRIDLQLVDWHLTFHVPPQEPVEVIISSANIKLDGPGKLALQLSSTVTQGSTSGQIKAGGRIDGFQDAAGRWKPQQVRFDGQATLAQLPVAFLDRMLQQDGRLVAAIGPTVQANLIAKGKLEDLDATIEIKSERLEARVRLVHQDNHIASTDDSAFRLDGDEHGWAALGEWIPSLRDTELMQPFYVEGRIKRFAIPISGQTARLADTSLDIELIGSDLVVALPGRVDPLKLSDARLLIRSDAVGRRIDAKLSGYRDSATRRTDFEVTATAQHLLDDRGMPTWDAIIAKVEAQITNLPTVLIEPFVPQLANLTGLALGRSVDMRIMATHDPATHTDRTSADLQFAIHSDNLDGQLQGRYEPAQLTDANGRLVFVTEPASLSAMIAKFDHKLPQQYQSLAIDKPVTATLTLENVAVPFASPVKGMTGHITVEVDQVAPTGIDRIAGTSLKNVKAELSCPHAGAPATFNIDMAIVHQSQPTTVHAEGTIGDLSAPTAQLDAKLTGFAASIALIEQLINRPGELTPIAGDEIEQFTVTVQHRDNPRDRWTFDAFATSAAGLDAKLVGHVLEGHTLNIDKISKLTAMISPCVFAAWMTNPNNPKTPVEWLLQKPARLELTFGGAQFVVRDRSEQADTLDGIEPAKSKIIADAVLDQLSIVRRGEQKPLPIDRLALALRADDLRKPIVLTIRSRLRQAVSDEAAATAVPLSVNVSIAGLYDAQGRYDPKHAVYETDTKINSFPTATIAGFLPQGILLATMIGPEVSIDAQGRISTNQPGDVDLVLESDFITMGIAATVGKVMVLREDANARFLQLTPPLVEHGLSNLLPLLGDAIGADQVITVKLMKDGFSLPLDEFDITKATAVAEINLGELKLRPKGELSKLLNVISHKKRGEEALAKSEPALVRLEKGVISYDKLTLHLEGIPLVFSGKVDLVAGKVDMMVGIPVDALAMYIKELRSIAQSNMVIGVPYRGPIGNAKLDLAHLGAEILRLTIENKGGQAIIDLLDGILNGKDKQEQDEQDESLPTKETAGDQKSDAESQNAPPSILDLIDDFKKKVEQRKHRKKEKKKGN